jgi:hypothetical protein
MSSLNLSHKTQLIATAFAASLTTASLLHAYNMHTKRVRRKELDAEVRQSINEDVLTWRVSDHSTPTESIQSYVEPKGLGHVLDYDEDLIREQLARNYAFFGEDGMAKIRKGRVVIVGCGGVGSWAAVMLVRSYVSTTNDAQNCH